MTTTGHGPRVARDPFHSLMGVVLGVLACLVAAASLHEPAPAPAALPAVHVVHDPDPTRCAQTLAFFETGTARCDPELAP